MIDIEEYDDIQPSQSGLSNDAARAGEYIYYYFLVEFLG